ncbi:DNA polymerase ligase N-terminal domain-containing protein [Cupriavidus basilensis]
MSDTKEKTDFRVTAEPAARSRHRLTKAPLRFVVQKHWARRLRRFPPRTGWRPVECRAVPKGPSFDPADKRIAIHVEDHPVDYAEFEGTIPPKQYGAGIRDCLGQRHVGAGGGRAGQHGERQARIRLRIGQKLAGRWELVRISKPGDADDQWMLFKKRDQWAKPHAEFDVISALPDGVITHPLGPVEDRESTSDSLPRAPICRPQYRRRRRRAWPRNWPRRPAKLPSGAGWIIETKFDGYRLLSRIIDAKVHLITRNGHDWTRKLGNLAKKSKELDISEASGSTVRSWCCATACPTSMRCRNAIDGHHNELILYFRVRCPLPGRA